MLIFEPPNLHEDVKTYPHGAAGCDYSLGYPAGAQHRIGMVGGLNLATLDTELTPFLSKVLRFRASQFDRH
jgi:hypothetical protein